jgi:hypothetical protein
MIPAGGILPNYRLFYKASDQSIWLIELVPFTMLSGLNLHIFDLILFKRWSRPKRPMQDIEKPNPVLVV